MTPGDGLERFRENLRAAPETPFQKALAAINRLREAIEQALQIASADALVRLEPGFQTQYGQQFRLVLTNQAQRFEHVLCRFYVPLEGTPVSLDLDGDTIREFSTAEEAGDELLRGLDREDTRGYLVGMLRQFAA
ncbi:MAG TPA: hypothetical protein PLH94_01715 [Fimbriimonadaceae bacterium]|nr:hypothetical protein [Fimbriimonadaceae bacterium]